MSQWPPHHLRKSVHERDAPDDDAEKRRSWHRDDGSNFCFSLPIPRTIRRAHRRDRRWLWRCALRKINPKLQVTLVEPNRTFTACPFSNEVIAGLRSIEAQQFGYDRIATDGLTVIAQAATRIEAQARTVALADGSLLAY